MTAALKMRVSHFTSQSSGTDGPMDEQSLLQNCVSATKKPERKKKRKKESTKRNRRTDISAFTFKFEGNVEYFKLNRKDMRDSPSFLALFLIPRPLLLHNLVLMLVAADHHVTRTVFNRVHFVHTAILSIRIASIIVDLPSFAFPNI